MCKDRWFVIVNPTSGSFSGKRKWQRIHQLMNEAAISFDFVFTQQPQHEEILVIEALEKGYRKFISVGGDGTLHHIVNGLMRQELVPHELLTIAVIPLGTGNDWVKTYQIPNDLQKAVQIIKKAHIVTQDIGKMTVTNSQKVVYFLNAAGLGFDGYVVQRNENLKFLGAASFLVSALMGLLKYKPKQLEIIAAEETITTKSLLTAVGICKFSGGGMQLTEHVDPTDGLFDISVAKNFSLAMLLKNISRLFNGSITTHKEVFTFKTAHIEIVADDSVHIQTDGELVGNGGFSAVIIPKKLTFVVPD